MLNQSLKSIDIPLAVAVLVGLIIFVIALIQPVGDLWCSVTGVSTTGEVIEIETDTTSITNSSNSQRPGPRSASRTRTILIKRPRVRFFDENGQAHVFKGIYTNLKTYYEGDVVNVRYLRDNPDRAVIAFSPFIFARILMAPFFGLIAAVGVAMIGSFLQALLKRR